MELGGERGAKGTSSNARSLSLEQWFSTEAGGDSLTTLRHLAVSGDVFGCHKWQGEGSGTGL